MQRVLPCLFALAALLQGALAAAGDEPAATSKIRADSSPIRKVITLIEEMKEQCEKESSEDLQVYDKYMCWCETNEKEKGAAIEEAENKIEELTAFLEEAAAKEAELKTEIATLEKDIADDKDALATATATRKKENDAFLASEADMKETKALLKEAIGVLSKVQLVQKGKSGGAKEHARMQTVLIQLGNKVGQRFPKFQGMMQKDLFDVFGSLENFVQRSASAGFLPKRAAASFEQTGRLLPWEKTEEQIGQEAKPNELKGAAANAKSYNSRSGGILGLLAEMDDQFTDDLSEAQTEDFQAEVSFQNLRAAKLEEIAVATQQKEDSEAELADLLNKAAKAKKDKEMTTEAMEADQEFLANMRKDCKHEDEEYKKRVDIRSKEIIALGETLKILTEDSARDLYDKTMSLLQVGQSSAEAAAVAQDRAAESAMRRIAEVARKHKNWALVSLAVRVRLDAFTKVKEAMDKMHAELTRQQKEEYAKWELCKKQIDKTEDDIKVGENTKEDLDEKHLSLVNTIDSLNKDIADLKREVEENKVSLKQAGEERKAQNRLFQTSVMDQRATTNILNKALARLKTFYQPGAELVEVHAHAPNEPGRAVAPPPSKGQAYAKSAGSGGVIQLLMKIISDAEVAEQQFHMDEQKAQEDYAEFVQVTTAAIEQDRAAIEEKTGQVADTEAEKSETEEAQLSNDATLAELKDLLKAHHVNCDYVLQYFDIRQKARQEEMDAITDAKAVLSGAGFGR